MHSRASSHPQRARPSRAQRVPRRAAPKRRPTKRMAAPMSQTRRTYTPFAQAPDEEAQNIHPPVAAPHQFGQSAHKLRVKLLYRRMLRETFNWYSHNHDAYLDKAEDLRRQFEAHRHETDVGVINTLLKQGESFIFEVEDPNPYRFIMHPQGGVQWSRNYPIQREHLKPPPSDMVINRDYFTEERLIRHIHAHPDDPEYCADDGAYARLQIARGKDQMDTTYAPIDPVLANYIALHDLEPITQTVGTIDVAELEPFGTHQMVPWIAEPQIQKEERQITELIQQSKNLSERPDAV